MAPERRSPSKGWATVGVFGELLITFGALILLFVAYQLWWTNVVADQAANQASAELSQSWRQAPPVPEATATPTPEVGESFALIYIPRLSSKVWGLPITEGIDAEELSKGLGHYPTSAMPGEIGNFAVAGHRATNGEPLRNIDQLKVGDLVYVETKTDWFVYRLHDDQIVQPDEMWVIDPVPGKPNAMPTERLMTITTCHPRWASYQRWIWWGTLVDHVDKSTGQTPEAIQAGP